MAGILDSLFGDLQGTSAGGLLGLLGGGGGIGTAARRLRTPEEEALAGYTPTDYTPAPPPPASLKGDYLGGTPAPPPLGPPINVPSLQVVGAPNGPYAQYSPTSAPAAPLPQQGSAGLGGGAQNPLMGLLGGIGNLFGTSSAQAAPAPGTAQQPGIPAQAAAGPAPAAGPGLFGRLQAGATNLSSGGNPLAGIINAFGGLATGERTDRQGIALQNQAAVAQSFQQAMEANGVPHAQAVSLAHAAALDPDTRKALAPLIYRTPTIEKLKDATGAENAYLIDPVKGTRTLLKDVGEGGGIGGGGPQMLAPGVKQYNPALTGNDYMAQFGPELQSVAKMYLKGDELPTGNPRIQGLFPFAKTIAAKYAQDMGIPFSDALYSEKRKFFTDLGSTSANTIGGQVKAFNQGMEHADKLATKLEQLGNYDPVGIAPVAHGINIVRGLSTKQADIVNSAKALGQTLAGEVGKLFSGQAGGGVHERELTRERFDTVSSPRELAGALEGTLETMDGGLRALEQQRDRVLGPNGAAQANFVTKETEAKIARIREVIGRLRGEAAPQQGTASQQTAPGAQQQAAPTGPAIKTKADFDRLPSGATYIDARDGKPYRKP